MKRPKIPMDLNKYTDPKTGVTVTIPDDVWIERGGKLANRRKQSFKGPANVFYHCPFCKEPQTSSNFRVHVPKCPQRPVETVRVPCEFCGKEEYLSYLMRHLWACKKNPHRRRRPAAKRTAA